MKNFLCLFAAFVLMLASCSKDDDNYNSRNRSSTDYVVSDPIQPVEDYPVMPIYSISPKAITYRMLKDDYDNFGYRTGDSYHYQVNMFNYNGNKIEDVICNYNIDGSNKNYLIKVVFTYSGNLIIKAESYLSDKLFGTTIYSYENEKIKQQVLTLAKDNLDFNSKIVYTYNDDGTVSYNKYMNDGKKAVMEKVVLTILNGNIIKKVLTRDTGSLIICDYKYDIKNNVFKNVLGINLIALGDLSIGADPLMLHNDFGISEFGTNNIIEKTTTVKYLDETISVKKEVFDLEYNNNGFPKKKHFNNYKFDQLLFNY